MVLGLIFFQFFLNSFLIFRFDYRLNISRLFISGSVGGDSSGDCWGDPRGRPFRAANPDRAIIYWISPGVGNVRAIIPGSIQKILVGNNRATGVGLFRPTAFNWPKRATTRVAPTHLSCYHVQNHIMLIILMCNTIANNHAMPKYNRAWPCLFPV